MNAIEEHGLSDIVIRKLAEGMDADGVVLFLRNAFSVIITPAEVVEWMEMNPNLLEARVSEQRRILAIDDMHDIAQFLHKYVGRIDRMLSVLEERILDGLALPSDHKLYSDSIQSANEIARSISKNDHMLRKGSGDDHARISAKTVYLQQIICDTVENLPPSKLEQLEHKLGDEDAG